MLLEVIPGVCVIVRTHEDEDEDEDEIEMSGQSIADFGARFQTRSSARSLGDMGFGSRFDSKTSG